ncbi:hypothetical protein K7432_015078 [Basidiobolus ranarum]|uniref:RRM domain-containing protein n=1 Tax=Basidiobolus ranarum TaxID=34480 RepID=A0ABR2VNK3_9FUNG
MSSRVYIGRLARDVRERDVEKLFKGYGDIREITLKNGFGFVEFRDQKDAEDVVYDFNGKEFFNERIIVELARGERKRNERNENAPRDRRETSRYGPPQRTQHRVIVENLASSASWQVWISPNTLLDNLAAILCDIWGTFVCYLGLYLNERLLG